MRPDNQSVTTKDRNRIFALVQNAIREIEDGLDIATKDIHKLAVGPRGLARETGRAHAIDSITDYLLRAYYINHD